MYSLNFYSLSLFFTMANFYFLLSHDFVSLSQVSPCVKLTNVFHPEYKCEIQKLKKLMKDNMHESLVPLLC